LEVALIEENVQDITKRIFTLTDTMSNESRTITQLQYLDWPDHGMPGDTASFLKIVKTASEASLPIIVHCSAGIGRTGSFCTVHSILEKLKYDMKQDPKKEHVINVPKTLQELKRQRIGMVERVEQYIFCYHAIADGVKMILENN